MNKEASSQNSNRPVESEYQESFCLKAAGTEWGSNFPNLKSLLETKIDTPIGSVRTCLHALGLSEEQLNYIPFDDRKGIDQRKLKNLIKPGEVAIAIKHHTPKPDQDPIEKLKFQATHIQIVVGLDDGVMTINNPRGYCGGGFGDSSYPSIFVKPTFPNELNEDQKKSYINNTRTWAVLLNTYSEFPGNYNGSDPLRCLTREKIIEFGKAIISAAAGNDHARNWLKQPDQKLYCAELAFVSFNLGLYFPLNRTSLLDNYEKVLTLIEQKAFLENHENPHIKFVKLEMAPDSLKPIDETLQLLGEEGDFWNGLAIQPFHSADIVSEYIKRSIPRIDLGEVKGASIQLEVLKQIRPHLHKVLNLSSERVRDQFDSLMDQTETIVGGVYSNYKEFQKELSSILNQLSHFSLQHGLAYIPPHCFLLRAYDSINKGVNRGVIGWNYVCHGFDQSLFK